MLILRLCNAQRLTEDSEDVNSCKERKIFKLIFIKSKTPNQNATRENAREKSIVAEFLEKNKFQKVFNKKKMI